MGMYLCLSSTSFRDYEGELMKVIRSYDEIKKVLKKDFTMVIAKSHTCSACESILEMMNRNISNLHQIEIHSIYIDVFRS